MSNSTYFLLECPTCGRRLQIRVEYLGKTLVCQHCQGKFQASDPANMPLDGKQENALLRRADELLECVPVRRPRLRTAFPR